MKALHIITGLGIGGAEQQLRLMLRHLPFPCDVVTLTNPGPVAEALTADGVRVTHLGMTGNRDLRALPRLVAHIRSGGYDLVHTHLYRACLYGRIAARIAGVPAVVATEHSLGDGQMEGRPLTPGVRALYLAGERLGHATVAVSPTVADRLRRWGVPRQRIHVVPNGIDPDALRYDPEARRRVRARYGLPEDAYVVGAVGRLVRGKRFDQLVTALAALPPDVRLLIVGAGPEVTALRRTALRAGVADRVVLTGEARPAAPDASAASATSDGGPDDAGTCEPPALPALLSAMDVLASPSPEEAFGLAVLEALAAGLPVRYVNCPALDDLPPGSTGDARRLAPGAESFAAALGRLRDAGPRERTVPPAVAHYAIARSAERLAGVYASIVRP
ncbi:glycosyltransferase [Streptomyces sp. NPDC059816]|uniref:glycosyltransferase n=1 Tax=Streptomyces sp. NPDC059816 TaxID=3346960 RepID=UPI00364F71BC